MTTKPLYVSRPVENADEIIQWAKDQGFKTTIKPGDMHVTEAYSREPVTWEDMGQDIFQDAQGRIIVPAGLEGRSVEPLGDEGAVVLKFRSSEISTRHKQMRRAGASWDYPSYMPHVTISYDGKGLDFDSIKPYSGKIVFGPEVFAEIVEDWQDKIEEATNS